VLPIPPGTHWSDAKPLILPGEGRRPALEGPSAPRTRKPDAEPPKAPAKPGPLSGALFFAPPARPAPAKEQKPPREKKPKGKNDPRLVAKARELRDRYLEHLAANPSAALVPARGKYDVSRTLQSAIPHPQSAIPCLPAA
jgi:hypothetical protein